MPAGRPGGPARAGAGRRFAVIAGGSCLILAAAACSTTAGPATHPASATPRPHRAAPSLSPAPSRAPMALQVTPAPYQLPFGISREVVLTRGRDLLIAGGLTQRSATTGAVRVLNPRTGLTTRAGRLAAPAHDAAGALLRGHPYVFGGGAQSSTAAVQGVASRGRAGVAGHLPQPRSDLASVTLGGTAYLLGGYDGASYDARVLATTDGRHFRTVATLPVPVRYPAVAGMGGKIWVFGGRSEAGPTSVIQEVSLTTGGASVVGHLPAPRTAAVGFALGGRIYVAGGQVPGGTGPAAGRGSASAMVTSNAVLAYEPERHTTVTAGRLPVPVANAAAAVLGGTVYLIGGNDGQRQVPTVTTLRLVAPADVIPPQGTARTTADPLTGAGSGAGGAATGTAGPASGAGAAAPAGAPWLGPPHGKGHLAPGSNPSALPGDILIADAQNNRLLIVDPHGRIRWQFPRRGDLRRGQRFLTPDDAFFSPDGRYIIATEEDYSVISVIDIATHQIVYRYGTPGVPGSTANHLAHPDDALMMPDHKLIAADIMNCRMLLLSPPSHRPERIIGQTGVCAHNPPHEFGSPNGAFPTTSGTYVVTEINGDWASEMSLSGHVYWSVHPPGVAYPSDTNEVYPGRFLTADYSPAGQVVEFGSRGRLLWRFGGLNHPSLALPLPNGDILVNDDYNDRVIVIDPVTNRIVWQYGHTGVPGSRPGYLNDPDGMDLAPPDSMLITHASIMGRP